LKSYSNYVNGGATIWARQTIDSEIFTDKPDKWFKIWFYLVNKANHSNSKQLNRGTCFMKYEWITKETKATHNQIDHCIRWLKSAKQIATQKATRGFTITILNYDKFQNLATYKRDKKRDDQRSKSDTINKNDKYIYSLFEFWNSLKIVVHKNIEKFKPNLNASLKIYSENEIKDAMQNYATIQKDKLYYWTHKYKLDEFLSRKGNIDRFLSVNKPWENWLVNKNNKQKEITPPYLE